MDAGRRPHRRCPRVPGRFSVPVARLLADALLRAAAVRNPRALRHGRSWDRARRRPPTITGRWRPRPAARRSARRVPACRRPGGTADRPPGARSRAPMRSAQGTGLSRTARGARRPRCSAAGGRRRALPAGVAAASGPTGTDPVPQVLGERREPLGQPLDLCAAAPRGGGPSEAPRARPRRRARSSAVACVARRSRRQRSCSAPVTERRSRARSGTSRAAPGGGRRSAGTRRACAARRCARRSGPSPRPPSTRVPARTSPRRRPSPHRR